jgi:opacity protein-like surface antigen
MLLACPAPAFADATAFLGVTPTPDSRAARGLAIGITVLVVGIEFEYSDTSEDLEAAAPSLRTGMANVIVQTPIAIGGLQFYGTAGGGVYRERLADIQETHLGANIGGGVKVSLLGPLKLRLDYRLFTLRGTPLHSKPQRVYAGLNLSF